MLLPLSPHQGAVSHVVPVAARGSGRGKRSVSAGELGRSSVQDKTPCGTIIICLTFLELPANLFLLTRAILFNKL